MIVRIMKAGRSFKALGAYLVNHDERVAWTHSLNCANDHVPSAIHEMYTTAAQAELLKEQAGVHGGGTALEKPVKHISLSWHPDELPTREQMIEAAEGFLKEMSWDQHQALLVAHDDRDHSHLHIMLNRVHPETGLAMKDGFEWRRAQAWALDYEREQGLIRCEQRLLDPAEREEAPTRGQWEEMKQADRAWEEEQEALRAEEPAYFQQEERADGARDHEWQMLKQHQRDERDAFFKEGKAMFKAVREQAYWETRVQFKPLWADYFEARRHGHVTQEQLADWKFGLEVAQAEAFAGYCDAWRGELSGARAKEYKELLAEQKEARAELRQRQEDGRPSYDLMDLTYPAQRETTFPHVSPELVLHPNAPKRVYDDESENVVARARGLDADAMQALSESRQRAIDRDKADQPTETTFRPVATQLTDRVPEKEQWDAMVDKQIQAALKAANEHAREHGRDEHSPVGRELSRD